MDVFLSFAFWYKVAQMMSLIARLSFGGESVGTSQAGFGHHVVRVPSFAARSPEAIDSGNLRD